MSARVSSRGTWLCGKYGIGDGATIGQLSSGSGSTSPPTSAASTPCGRRVRAASRSSPRCGGGRSRRCAAHAAGLRLVVEAGAPRRDPTLGADVGHLREQEAGAADRAGAEVHEVPVVGHAVGGRVLAHRRHRNPIDERHAAQAERREQRRRRRRDRHLDAGLPRRLGREPQVDAGDEGGIAHLQVLVSDAQAAGEQREGEIERIERHVALGVLEPLEARLRRALQALDRGPPRRSRRRRAPRGRRRGLERLHQRDRVLHRQLGAGADREVRRVRGVAGEHEVAVMPGAVANGREAAPDRAVRDQPVARQLVGEQRARRTRSSVASLACSSPAARHVSSRASTMKVEWSGSYW